MTTVRDDDGQRLQDYTSCIVTISRKEAILKTIIELTHEELLAVLENGSLKAFADTIPWEAKKVVVGSGNRVSAPEQAPTQAPAQSPAETAESPQVATPAPAQAPAQAAPTGEVAYTFEQLQRACATLVRDGKREELKAVIDSMQLNSVVELKPEQFNTFAAKIREIGGVL